ncbi:MAG: hypothetical protein IKF36_06520 [Bacilli bacterium]|nr:hypothetical protein [Bacilli bacterium]
MNEMVKNSIEARRNAIFSTYDIKDQGLLDRIDEFFNRLNEYGSKYDDVMKFETDFASSDLCKEYGELFMIINSTINPEPEVDEGKELLKEAAGDVTRYAKRTVKEDLASKARSTPIIGDVMEAKQYADFFGRFKKKKDKDE